MALEWITGERISLVFQGAIGHKGSDFGPAARAARAAMPDAEIILSTWEGAAVDPAWPLDRVVFSPDPGPVFIEPITGRPNNVLRQATSTFAGLQAATRPFAAKIRTDFVFSGERLPLAAAEPDHTVHEPPVFSRPISVPVVGTRDTVLSGLGFHPSDFFSFGAHGDMLKLWDFHRPMDILGDATVALRSRLRNYHYGACFYRFPPEQEIILSLLVRTGRVELAQRIAGLERSPAMTKASNQFLSANFRVFPFATIGLAADPRLAGAIMVTRNVNGDPQTGAILPGTVDAPAWVSLDAFLQNTATLLVAPFGDAGKRALARLVPAAKLLRARLMMRMVRGA